MLYIIIIGLIVLGFLLPKSKVVHILLLFLSYSLFTLSYDDGDRLIYMEEYENIGSGIGSDYEILYVALMKVCSFFGLTFYMFRFLTAGITFFCLEYVTTKYCKNINIVWALYFIFSAMFDATVIRNSLAMGIALIVLVKMLSKKNLKDEIICYGLSFVAALIHSSYWILPLILALWKPMQKTTIRYVFVVSVLLLYSAVSAYDQQIFSIYGSLLVREATIDKYMTGFYSNTIGQIYNFVKYCIIISPVIVFWPNRMLKKIPICAHETLIRNIFLINLLFIVILLPQAIATNFSRLLRIIIFLNYVYLACCYDVKKYRLAIAVYGVFYSSTLLLLLLLFESITSIDIILNMHLETNEIFKMLNF